MSHFLPIVGQPRSGYNLQGYFNWVYIRNSGFYFQWWVLWFRAGVLYLSDLIIEEQV